MKKKIEETKPTPLIIIRRLIAGVGIISGYNKK